MLVVVSISIMAYIWLYQQYAYLRIRGRQAKKLIWNITHGYALDVDAVITILGKQPKQCVPFLGQVFYDKYILVNSI